VLLNFNLTVNILFQAHKTTAGAPATRVRSEYLSSTPLWPLINPLTSISPAQHHRSWDLCYWMLDLQRL